MPLVWVIVSDANRPKNHQKCPKLVLETFNCHELFSLLGPSMRGLKPCFFSISICCHCLVFLLWLAKHGPILKYSLHQHSTYYTVSLLTSIFFFLKALMGSKQNNDLLFVFLVTLGLSSHTIIRQADYIDSWAGFCLFFFTSLKFDLDCFMFCLSTMRGLF